MSLLWLFLMSICCKRHVQSPLVSTQPHAAFGFVLTSDHLWLDLSSRTWVWHVTWPIMARSHLVCQTELSLVETRLTHIWWCDSRGTWMPTPVSFTTQCTSAIKWHQKLNSKESRYSKRIVLTYRLSLSLRLWISVNKMLHQKVKTN